ncbi:MAG TPA: phosphonate ABC transporter, permease protein PhnE [Acidimicrobiia bacterium]
MSARVAGVGDRPVRPPLTWQRLQLPVLTLAVLVLFVVSLIETDSSPARFLGSFDELADLFARMWPPVATEWPRYLEATWVTLAMVVAATGLAFLISVPVAILAAANTTPHPVVHVVARGATAMARAIPSIVWALLLVRAIGIGPVAGVLAMTLSSFGMLGKLFADAVETVDRRPLDALTAAGATRTQVFVGGVLPQVLATWFSLSLFRLDINVRRSVILGFVGAGGIGFELQRVLGQLAYQRALTIVAIIFVFVIALERLSAWIRSSLIDDGAVDGSGRMRGRDRTAKWVAGLIAVAGFVVSSWAVGLTPGALGDALVGMGQVARRMFPPDFVTNWNGIVAAMAETVWIALAATVMGLAIALPIAVLAARNTTPRPWVSVVSRGVMVLERGIPELVLAVVFVVAVGLGPFAGVLALTVGAIGFTGKLLADGLETLPDSASVGLASVGASWSQRTTGAVLRQGMPLIVGVGVYTLDVYVRAATVLGVVGAGGIGGILNSTIQSHRYDRTLAICLIVFVLIYGFERLAGWIRRKLV